MMMHAATQTEADRLARNAEELNRSEQPVPRLEP